MWFRGLNFAVPAFFMTLWTMHFGGASALLAWGVILYKYWMGHSKLIPSALYMFTVAVCVDFVGYHFLDRVPYDIRSKVVLGTSLVVAAWTAYLTVSLIFLILSLVCLRGYRGPGRRVLQTGSVFLVVVQSLGFIVIILTLPGMPLSC
jgi:hypothetical protein